MYTVRWKRSARDQLAELWMQAPDRNAVTDAANQIDSLLERSPEQQGESRPGGRRILILLPLAVLFRVNEQDKIVAVLKVWAV